MQTLLMVRLVTFRLESQPERRGMAGVCPDAQLVLKLVDHQTPAPPNADDEFGWLVLGVVVW